MTEQLLTARQVADLLNIRISTVYALCRRKALPHIRLAEGRRRALIRFSAAEIQRVVRQRTVQPSGDGDQS